MKSVFKWLFNKYSKSESDRIEIYKVLHDKTSTDYNEQTMYGNIYNAGVEFLMANPLVNEISKNGTMAEINAVKSLLNDSLRQSIIFLTIK
jgi:hypothetical protein